MFKNRYQALSKAERRAFWITVAMVVIFAVFSAIVFDTQLEAPDLQYFLVYAIPIALTIISFASALIGVIQIA